MTIFQLHHFLHIYQSTCIFSRTYEFYGLMMHVFDFQIISLLADRNPIGLPLMALCHDLIALEHILFPRPASYTMLILYPPLSGRQGPTVRAEECCLSRRRKRRRRPDCRPLSRPPPARRPPRPGRPLGSPPVPRAPPWPCAAAAASGSRRHEADRQRAAKLPRRQGVPRKL